MRNRHSSFFDKVYGIVREIPAGRVTSYGAIARFLGSVQSARMVGWALNVSHSNIELPAHRVVNSLGLLTGKHHFDGPEKMEQLLKREGIKVVNNQVLDFNEIFWDPMIELVSDEIF